MSQFQPDMSDIIECVDIFAQIKRTQWLVQSMEDAISARWSGESELTDNLAYLINVYSDKMEELISDLDQAFEKVQPSTGCDELMKDLMTPYKK